LLLFALGVLLLSLLLLLLAIKCGGGETEEFGELEFKIVTDSWIKDCCGERDLLIAGITIPLFGPTTAILTIEFGAIFMRKAKYFK
jgi:hypothetical protein